MTCVAGASRAPIEAVGRRVLKKEGHILIQGGLIELDREKIVPSCGQNLLTKTALGKESIGTNDAPGKQNGSEKEVQVSQLPSFLRHSDFFEHNPRFRFIQIEMMHFSLICGQMLLGSPQRLSIEHDMFLFCGFA